MSLCQTKLSIVGLLLTGFVFLNQNLLHADPGSSSHYEKGVARITTKEGKTGTINWETRYIISKGISVANTLDATNSSQRKLLARRGAIVDAQRNLMEIIKGVKIDTTTTVSDHLVEDIIRTNVKGTLKSAEIIDESWDGKLYKITMQVPMGKIYKVFKKKEKLKSSVKKAIQPKDKEHTGLVIDARSLNLIPAMFVNIYNEEGKRVFGPIHPVYRVSEKKINNIKEERIGTNPLRISAKRTIGSNSVDLVISKKKLKKIKQMVLARDIFSKNKVVILID